MPGLIISVIIIGLVAAAVASPILPNTQTISGRTKAMQA